MSPRQSALFWLLVLSIGFAHPLPVPPPSPTPPPTPPPRNHGPGVYCGPIDLEDLFIFFLLNYAAHVATVKSFPGNTLSITARWAASALLVPYSGIVRGCAAIASSRSFTGETQMQHAARAGALCALRRTSAWQPKVGATLEGCKISSGETQGWATLSILETRTKDIDFDNFVVHGHLPRKFPDGLVLSKLPMDTAVDTSAAEDYNEIQLARSAVLLKSLVSIIQLLFAVVTLYRTRGEQVKRFGYAAFGLTVIPYAVMSLINLIAHCMNPDYPALFFVENSVLRDSRGFGVFVDGVIGRQEEGTKLKTVIVHETRQGPCQEIWIRYEIVGRSAPSDEVTDDVDNAASLRSSSSITLNEVEVDPIAKEDKSKCDDKSSQSEPPKPDKGASNKPHAMPAVTATIEICDFGVLNRRGPGKWRGLIAVFIGAVGLVTPYIIIGVFTRFSNGTDDRTSDRVWTMAWLVFGQVFGFLLGGAMQMNDGRKQRATWVITLLILLAGIPAIGGLVTVGKMLIHKGDCILL